MVSRRSNSLPKQYTVSTLPFRLPLRINFALSWSDEQAAVSTINVRLLTTWVVSCYNREKFYGQLAVHSRSAFHSTQSATSITKACQPATGNCTDVYGRQKQIMVVDTPGFFDTNSAVSNAMVERTITSQIFNMTSPGVHAFLIVLRIDRFTPEEKQTINFIKTIFGAGAARYCILIFTREDQLDPGQTLDNFISSSSDLQELASTCGNRKIAINNKLNGELLERKTKELVQMIEGMVAMNNGTYYTNAEYQRIEAERRAEQQRREQEERDRKQRYEDELKAKVSFLILLEAGHPSLDSFISGS